ncbi:FeoB-associated Cys-rich membrane protein [bacterium]|nr:FeoB-associated Cys-rich membrane protein [bacterium]
MSVILQWIIVGILVVLASVYLARRFAKSSRGDCTGCSGCKTASNPDCSNCPLADPDKLSSNISNTK